MAVVLNAQSREDLKKSYTRQLRSKGFVPAIVYGKQDPAKPISVNELELVKTVRDEGRNAIIQLKVEDGASFNVMLHEYQLNPLKDEVVHADFYVVNMNEEIEATVPIRVTGEAIGSKNGGVLQQPLFEIAVRAKPADVPEEIEVDVTDLDIGEGLTVGDLKASGNYTFAEDEETTVVTITAPTIVEEAETDSEDETAEPERVGDDKSE